MQLPIVILMIIIAAFPSGQLQTNAYILACPTTRQAAIIDPAPGSAEYIDDYLKQHHLTPKSIIITHSHFDHIGDAAKVKATYNIPIYVHPLDAPNLERPGSDGIPLFTPVPKVSPDHFLNDGDQISVGNLTFNIIHTPGHARGSICLYEPKEGVLISGDTLFKGSIGVLHLPTAEPDKMWESLAKLAALPSQTKVYPGHGPSTTIGAENWLSNAKQIFGD